MEPRRRLRFVVVPAPRRSPATRDGGLGLLTGREREVLEALATGARTRDIAARLGITEPTVKRHLTNIYRKIDATNRVEAVTRFLAAGRSRRRPRR